MKKIIVTIFIFTLFTGLLLFSGQQKMEKQEQKEYKPVLKEYGGFCYAYLRYKGPYTLIGEKWHFLKDEFKKQGLKPLSDFIAVYYNSPRIFKKEELEWSVALAVAKDANVRAPLKKTEFKKTQCVVMIHTGPLEIIQESNDKVKKFFDDNEYTMAWPVFEIFHNDPPQVEIIHPVK